MNVEINRFKYNEIMKQKKQNVLKVLLTVLLFHIWSNPISAQNTEKPIVPKPKSQEVLQTRSPEMVFVQGGTFWMGCTSEQGDDCDDSESHLHSVTVSSFNIGKYEVTQAQWKLIMGNNPSKFKGDKLPVEMVSWNDVEEFIRRLNAKTGKKYRLPTETEWEYAARGGSKSNGYKYSGSHNLNNIGWFGENSNETSHHVGSKLPNELGIYDMSGNVYEWCSDWFGDYPASAQQDPIGASSGSDRVYRGGCWYGDTSNCLVANRFNTSPDIRHSGLGFRLVVP
jgi:formylglycine-generating enzyme required for sulfatase activity